MRCYQDRLSGVSTCKSCLQCRCTVYRFHLLIRDTINWHQLKMINIMTNLTLYLDVHCTRVCCLTWRSMYRCSLWKNMNYILEYTIWPNFSAIFLFVVGVSPCQLPHIPVLPVHWSTCFYQSLCRSISFQTVHQICTNSKVWVLLAQQGTTCTMWKLHKPYHMGVLLLLRG